MKHPIRAAVLPALALLLACEHEEAPRPAEPVRVEGSPERGGISAQSNLSTESSGTPTLLSAPSDGIVIRTTPSGGSPIPKKAGALSLSKKDRQKRAAAEGKMGKVLGSLHGSEIGEASGLGGLGMGGIGTGGGGAGYGFGSNGTIGRGGRGPSVGVRASGHQRSDVEKSPWDYAEIQLPYGSGTTPGKFPSRQDAKINSTTEVKKDYLSTFGADVDTAAYSIARRALRANHMPNPTLVRVEEFVNYFRYDYDPPRDDEGLFAIQADGARSPVDDGYLLRIGLQARIVEDPDRLPANLVFLVDTSCSMTPDDRLPLVKKSLKIAVDRLTAKDRVAVTTYAGGVRLVLQPTPGDQKKKIKDAIDSLTIGGGTAMASGLNLAYVQATQMLRSGAITRIIVCSDGDANIGATTPEEMLAQLHSYVSEGVTLSTIGYGDDNYRDSTMQQLADKGNGNYFYVDTIQQAERVFGRDFTKMIQDVAEDVKIQVELDADSVKSFRLVGYEKRDIANEDFRNDKVDAGEIGAGHQVTAIYALELNPEASGRLGTVRLRAKKPGGTTAKETALPLMTSLIQRPFAKAPSDFRLAIAVMGAAELLRNSPYAGAWTMDQVIDIAQSASSPNDADRSELIQLMQRAKSLMPAPRFARQIKFD